MKITRWLPAVMLGLGCLCVRPAQVRAAENMENTTATEGTGVGTEAKKSNLRGWSFLWKSNTIEKKIGEKLTKEQGKKIDSTRDEIRKKYQKEIEGPNKENADKAGTAASDAYKAALKDILSQPQFEMLFPEKLKKADSKKTEKADKKTSMKSSMK